MDIRDHKRGAAGCIGMPYRADTRHTVKALAGAARRADAGFPLGDGHVLLHVHEQLLCPCFPLRGRVGVCIQVLKEAAAAAERGAAGRGTRDISGVYLRRGVSVYAADDRGHAG